MIVQFCNFIKNMVISIGENLEILPVKTEQLPDKTEELPVETEQLPVETEELPTITNNDNISNNNMNRDENNNELNKHENIIDMIKVQNPIISLLNFVFLPITIPLYIEQQKLKNKN